MELVSENSVPRSAKFLVVDVWHESEAACLVAASLASRLLHLFAEKTRIREADTIDWKKQLIVCTADNHVILFLDLNSNHAFLRERKHLVTFHEMTGAATWLPEGDLMENGAYEAAYGYIPRDLRHPDMPCECCKLP